MQLSSSEVILQILSSKKALNNAGCSGFQAAWRGIKKNLFKRLRHATLPYVIPYVSTAISPIIIKKTIRCLQHRRTCMADNFLIMLTITIIFINIQNYLPGGWGPQTM